ncbi:MAG: hypothetical protein HYY55_01855 [Candidatus Niyogibacteria bacterium]|nr:MAG: hypothetical protein HYY55_01855 [Candidatus Niyogibacteria bacterium]
MKPKIRFNEKRALDIFRILADLWKKRAGIFQGVLLPQEKWLLPSSTDSRDYANWLFFASMPMRGGIMSELPFKLWWTLQRKTPELFRPEIISKDFSPKTILEVVRLTLLEILEENGAPLPANGDDFGFKLDELSRWWHQNAKTLNQCWGNSVLNIFNGAREFEGAFAKISPNGKSPDGFRGVRRKIFSLFVIWLQERNLIPIFPAPIPVDFHAIRVLWATEILDLSGIAKPFEPKTEGQKKLAVIAGLPTIRVSEKFTDAIAIWSQKFLQKHGISHLNINPALWVLSRDFCKWQIQNKIRGGGTLFFSAETLEKNPELWPTKHNNPCKLCPIEKFCTGVVPNHPYSRQGLLARGRRAKHPQLELILEGR